MKRSCIRLLSLWLAAACALSLSGCAGPAGTQDSSAPAETAASSSSGSTQNEETQTASESSVPSADGFYTLAAEDTKVSCDPAELTASVTLNGFSASAEGTGVKVEGQTVTVTEGGTYSFKGSLSDGQIVVDTEKGEIVRLILDGVSITCSDGAPIFGKQAAKIIVTLTEGSENFLTDGESYAGVTEENNEPNAALFAKNDLVINGSGSLSVNARFNNGIGTKDGLILTGGAVTVTAAANGLKGNDFVFLAGGDYTVTAGGDGVKSDNAEDAALGWVRITGGSLTVFSDEDAVQPTPSSPSKGATSP